MSNNVANDAPQVSIINPAGQWIPAFAGMTKKYRDDKKNAGMTQVRIHKQKTARLGGVISYTTTLTII